MVDLPYSTNLLIALFIPTKLAHFYTKTTLRIHFLGLINCEFEGARGPRNTDIH